MKIVFVISELGFGGAERVVSILANQMSKEHTIKIVLSSGKKECAYQLEDGIEVYRVIQSVSVFTRWSMVRKECIKFNADIVLSFMDATSIMTSVFLLGSGIPVIASERNDPTQKSRRLGKVLEVLRLISYFATSGYVFQSEGAKSFYPRIVQKKSCVILNPLDVSMFPSRNLESIEKTVVNVGRLHKQKNQELLINAFIKSKYYDDHTLHIYGDGELRHELERLVSINGAQEKVILEGNVKKIHECIKNAGLFVFTSDYEGLPNALMEAMALGIPCISTDCSPGGARMLIKNGENGILVHRNNVTELIEAMNQCYDNLTFRIRIGEKAKEIIKYTSAEVITKEWLEYIDSIINKMAK